MKVDYPEEWDELPRRERKQKIRELKKASQKKAEKNKKVKNFGIAAAVLIVLVFSYKFLTQESPEQVAFQEEVEEVSLEGKVEEFEIEGADHITLGTTVDYQTNPPTSGSHLGQAQNWGVYNKEVVEESTVHSLEHGGIWITYKDISEEEKKILEEIGRENPQSVIVSPRAGNDAKIAVVSWGRMMKLESADKALIQKYIDTYINQSPEKFAR